MKFYRVWYQNYEGVQKGYSWFTSRADARRDIAMWKRQQRKEFRDIALKSNIAEAKSIMALGSLGTASGEMEGFEITPTKQGILKALNSYMMLRNNSKEEHHEVVCNKRND